MRSRKPSVSTNFAGAGVLVKVLDERLWNEEDKENKDEKENPSDVKQEKGGAVDEAEAGETETQAKQDDGDDQDGPKEKVLFLPTPPTHASSEATTNRARGKLNPAIGCC